MSAWNTVHSMHPPYWNNSSKSPVKQNGFQWLLYDCRDWDFSSSLLKTPSFYFLSFRYSRKERGEKRKLKKISRITKLFHDPQIHNSKSSNFQLTFSKIFPKQNWKAKKFSLSPILLLSNFRFPKSPYIFVKNLLKTEYWNNSSKS